MITMQSFFLAAVALCVGVIECRPPRAHNEDLSTQNAGCLADGLLDGSRVGPIHLGMRLNDVFRECPGSSLIQAHDEEGAPSEIVVIPLGGDTISARLDSTGDARVVRNIAVRSARIRSPTGLGVGSTVEELRSKGSQWHRGLNEAVVLVWPEPDDGISFRLSIDYAAVENSWDSLGLTGLPDSAHVTEILVRGIQ